MDAVGAPHSAGSSTAASSAATLSPQHVLLFLLSRCPEGVVTTANIVALLLLGAIVTALVRWLCPGGPAWGRYYTSTSSGHYVSKKIPGPRGWPLLGNLLHLGDLAHVRLATLARHHAAKTLMAFSLGDTRAIITSSPSVAREILHSQAFADRPVKQSARLLLFHRAIGFAPYGDYWRKLRRIAASHLFSPKRISSMEPHRQLDTSLLLESIQSAMSRHGSVRPRPLLQHASLNNIMKSVFGLRYDFDSNMHNPEASELQRMTREGFDLLGAFNLSDHLPWLAPLDLQRVNSRCRKLVAEVQVFVQRIIDDHRDSDFASSNRDSDFVDVLLSIQESENLSDTDIIAVLWEMIFRGTDTTAILMEWILAEMALNPAVQARAHAEIDNVVGQHRTVRESDVAQLPYVQAIVKEALRLHPPGPLLSWARLATSDVDVGGFHVPAGTTAMVNMWAITHDADIWEEPHKFKPERFLDEDVDIDIRGGDLRLAPFGSGRRVCPGRALGLATVHLWAARLLHHFTWVPAPGHPVDLSEVLKLSCEMKSPLCASATLRVPLQPRRP